MGLKMLPWVDNLYGLFMRTHSKKPRVSLALNPGYELMLWSDHLLLRRRAIIETIIDQLKNISQIEHSRHRSIIIFFVNVLCGLIAYSRRPSKPSLGLADHLPLPA